jgi:hypothetical protein
MLAVQKHAAAALIMAAMHLLVEFAVTIPGAGPGALVAVPVVVQVAQSNFRPRVPWQLPEHCRPTAAMAVARAMAILPMEAVIIMQPVAEREAVG